MSGSTSYLNDPTLSMYSSQIQAASQSSGTPLSIMQFVAAHEDASGDPDAVNPSTGATGVAQIEPATASDPGYGISSPDPTDPTSSFDFMGNYLQALYQKTGSWAQAVEDYGTTAGNPGLQQQFQTLLSGFDGGYASGTSGTPNGIGGPTAAEQVPETNLSGYLSELATRAALIILGLVCLMGGFVILGRENVAPAISRQVDRITR